MNSGDSGRYSCYGRGRRRQEDTVRVGRPGVPSVSPYLPVSRDLWGHPFPKMFQNDDTSTISRGKRTGRERETLRVVFQTFLCLWCDTSHYDWESPLRAPDRHKISDDKTNDNGTRTWRYMQNIICYYLYNFRSHSRPPGVFRTWDRTRWVGRELWGWSTRMSPVVVVLLLWDGVHAPLSRKTLDRPTLDRHS